MLDLVIMLESHLISGISLVPMQKETPGTSLFFFVCMSQLPSAQIAMCVGSQGA
jgi:hypothetical protein